MHTRHQLSLFVPPPTRESLEEVRQRLDPIQARLIPAHVTLAREDELAGLDLETLRTRFAAATRGPIRLRFGGPEAFQGHGVLLPCIAGESHFRVLRGQILGPGPLRRQVPHITLAHPRNPPAAGDGVAAAPALAGGLAIAFGEVRYIRQDDAEPWQVVATFALGDTSADVAGVSGLDGKEALLVAAHRHASLHRREIESSVSCGCFYCCATFPPSAIEEWIDAGTAEDDGQTALCPRCGVDSVLGSASGVDVGAPAFLEAMRRRWF